MYSATFGSGINMKEIKTIARPATTIEDIVPGKRELYCSANYLKNICLTFWRKITIKKSA